MSLKFNWDRKPLYDVIARIPGSEYPDQWVIRRQSSRRMGQRRGTIRFPAPVTVMEEVRALTELIKQG